MDDFFAVDPQVSGVKGIVFIGDKILVYRRDGKIDYYPFALDFPGGGADKNETPFETFRREVKEEFNLDLKKDDIVYFRKYPGIRYPDTVSYFPVAKLPKSVKHKIRLGDEGLEWFLMDINEYLENNDSVEFLVKRTKDYLNYKS